MPILHGVMLHGVSFWFPSVSPLMFDAYPSRPCSDNMALANKTENAISYSIMTAMLIMSGTGGIVDFYSIEEVSIILCVSITGTLTMVYLVADYSATLTLAEREM